MLLIFTEEEIQGLGVYHTGSIILAFLISTVLSMTGVNSLFDRVAGLPSDTAVY